MNEWAEEVVRFDLAAPNMPTLEASEILHWERLSDIDNAGIDVTYERDGVSATLRAVPRIPKRNQRNEQDFLTVTVDKSFIVKVSEIDDAGLFPPVKFDTISYSEGSIPVRYEVMSDGSENTYDPSGNYGIMITIHCKRITTV